jgi:hypothetical protein
MEQLARRHRLRRSSGASCDVARLARDRPLDVDRLKPEGPKRVSDTPVPLEKGPRLRGAAARLNGNSGLLSEETDEALYNFWMSEAGRLFPKTVDSSYRCD